MYECGVCREMLTVQMCQSGVTIDGEDLPAHVGCADAWYATELTVYKITSPGNGSYYEEFPENVTEMLKESEEEHEYVIKRTKMSRANFENLEEFTGF